MSEVDSESLRDAVRAIMDGRADDAVLHLKRSFDTSPYMVQVIDVEYRRKRK